MGLGHIRTLVDTKVLWPSAMARYVGLSMAYHADSKGIIRTSQTELAEESLVAIKTVARAVDALCEAGIYVRLGHGRYGVRFGLPTDNDKRLPAPKGADKELQRLLAIRQPNEAIYYRKDGWPVLGER